MIPECPQCGDSTMEEIEVDGFTVETLVCFHCKCEFKVTILEGDEPVYEVLTEGVL